VVIAKLDRLSRNLAFIATLMDSGVEFVAVDNPHANNLTIHILAAVAQHEREIISARTSAALKVAKARGKRLGNPKLSQARRSAAVANKEKADRYSANVRGRQYKSARFLSVPVRSSEVCTPGTVCTATIRLGWRH
jgi:DNA invertase Pin-like site-specific DNA recombinase